MIARLLEALGKRQRIRHGTPALLRSVRERSQEVDLALRRQQLATSSRDFSDTLAAGRRTWHVREGESR
jgi:hypothetical protein